jgi:hypothetical protein
MLDQKNSRKAEHYDTRISNFTGYRADRKHDYLRGVYESDSRFLGRTLIEERELMRGLPVAKNVITEGTFQKS